MSGAYSLLPLAVRVRSKIAQIIREEMDAIGSQEFLLPALHPAELWQKSGRWEIMGEEMFRLRDRRDADIALGMTHEEVFAVLASELDSYRQLPQMWYQIQTKFRDEPRPKSGLLRTREFTMKDAYTFDLEADGLDKGFELQRGAYEKIFARLGLDAIAVEASSGAMGGSGSVEFIAPADYGEDEVARCPNGDYAANLERAVSRVDPIEDPVGADAPEKFATPGVRTIDALVEFEGGAAADRQIKTMVYVLDGRPALVLLRGDHQLQEQKLADGTGVVELRPAHPEEVRELLGADPGSLGAVGVDDMQIIADPALRGRHSMTTGANEDDFHLRGVDVERDIAVGDWIDVRRVAAGEPCPECGAPLEVLSGIEVGHIFKLGPGYAEALGATVADADGNQRVITMGSYGIGLERNLAAIVETSHDDKGIIWPVAVAPYEVVVTVLGIEEETTADAGERLYADLRQRGIDVLVDDRSERPGVKFTDAELIGFPYRVTVGRKGLERAIVELTERRSGEGTDVPLDEAASHIADLVTLARD
jgi:prolyl-tRNA synthetase